MQGCAGLHTFTDCLPVASLFTAQPLQAQVSPSPHDSALSILSHSLCLLSFGRPRPLGPPSRTPRHLRPRTIPASVPAPHVLCAHAPASPRQRVLAGRSCRRGLRAEALAARALLHGARTAGRCALRRRRPEMQSEERPGPQPLSAPRRPECETGSGHVPPACTAREGCWEPGPVALEKLVLAHAPGLPSERPG